MIHYGTTLIYYLSWTSLETIFLRLLKQSNNICHHCWIKIVYNSNVFLCKFSTHSEVSKTKKNQNLFVSNRVIKTTLSCDKIKTYGITLVLTAHIQILFASLVKVKP
jgi:hypothetical protein